MSFYFCLFMFIMFILFLVYTYIQWKIGQTEKYMGYMEVFWGDFGSFHRSSELFDGWIASNRGTTFMFDNHNNNIIIYIIVPAKKCFEKHTSFCCSYTCIRMCFNIFDTKNNFQNL